jgi:hypothetical protein
MESEADSDMHQPYSEPEITGVKQKHLVHPPIYSIWKYDVQVRSCLGTVLCESLAIPLSYLTHF